MKMKFVKFCLISILLVLFIYQSRRTIRKYQAEKTSLQVNLVSLVMLRYLSNKVTMTDEGSILFPSVTICKDEMFDNLKYSNRGLLPRLRSGEVSAGSARSWFRNRTFSRGRLVKFLSLKTVEGSNNYPCNTARGPRAGEPCAFPFFFPDCKLETKEARCESDPGVAREEYRGCYNDEDITSYKPWCYTRTYHNRSHITGNWGYCSQHCTSQKTRSVSSKIYLVVI